MAACERAYGATERGTGDVTMTHRDWTPGAVRVGGAIAEPAEAKGSRQGALLGSASTSASHLSTSPRSSCQSAMCDCATSCRSPGSVPEIVEEVLPAVLEYFQLPRRTARCCRGPRRHPAAPAVARTACARRSCLSAAGRRDRCPPDDSCAGGVTPAAARIDAVRSIVMPTCDEVTRRLEPRGPSHQQRNTNAAFPQRGLAMEQRRVAREPFTAVVAGEDDQRVLRELQPVERVQNAADALIGALEHRDVVGARSAFDR